jgi:hypothetical protein
MWELVVFGYFIAVGGAFVAADAFPRWRKALHTVGAIGVAMPLILVVGVVVFLMVSLRGDNIHFG